MPPTANTAEKRHKNGARNLAILSVISIFALLRFVNLDADPGMFKRIGDIGDEGFFGAEARNTILYGQFLFDEWAEGAATAPLYNAFSYLFFKIFGVNLYTLRLTSAVFGVATILLLYVFLRRYHSTMALWSCLFLSINYNFFIYHRIAHVETLVSFFILLTFYFLENRDSWFWAGISVGLAVASKIVGMVLFPILFFYVIFKSMRGECSKQKCFRLILGGAIIAIPLVYYQYRFFDVFNITLQCMTAHMTFLEHLLKIPFRIASLFTNSFFINPLNALLMICLVEYLRRVGSIRLFSKEAKNYVHLLKPLDIIVLSWTIGVTVFLIFVADYVIDRRIQVLSLVFSMAPGILLFRDWEKKAKPFSSNMVQALITLLPVATLGTFYGQRLFSLSFFVSGWLNLAAIIIISGICTYVLPKCGKALYSVSLIALIIGMSLPFIHQILYLFAGSAVSPPRWAFWGYRVLLIVFGVSLWRHVKCIHTLLIASLMLVIFEVATPTFSVRDTSRYLNTLIDNDDIVVGPVAIELSYEARFHPVMWMPSFFGRCQTMNGDVVRQAKPRYLLYCDDWKGQGTFPLDQIWPTKEHFIALGATKFRKIHSFGLYPVLGKARAKFSVYEVSYAEP